MNKYNNGVVN